MRYLNFKHRVVAIFDFIARHFLDGLTIAVIAAFCVFTITGTKPMLIMSGSMEPVIKTGSIVIGKKVANDLDISVGDIYTYKNPNKNYTITHRIVSANDGGFVFKGDNNQKRDPVLVEPEWIQYKIIWYPQI